MAEITTNLLLAISLAHLAIRLRNEYSITNTNVSKNQGKKGNSSTNIIA